MPKNIITVNMNQVRFSSEKSTLLMATGVTTCITFLIRGTFWDDDDEACGFIGMYHWVGVENPDENFDDQVKKELLYFLAKVREFAGIEEDEVINIDLLKFIGGEKEQRDDENEIIVSGTEAEVNALIKAVKGFDFAKYHFKIAPKAITHHHFLTKNEESVSVGLTLSNCGFEIIKPELTEELDSETSMQLV